MSKVLFRVSSLFVGGMILWKLYNKITKSKKYVIHFDVNKTIILSDSAHNNTLRASLNAIFADTCCYGKIIKHNNQSIWKAEMITTDESKADGLMLYGAFVREQLPYNDPDVYTQIRKQRRMLLDTFTDDGKDGEMFQSELDNVYQKMVNRYFTKSFENFIHFMQKSGKEYSIVFRTFGMDLPAVIKRFNQFCQENGYSELMVSDKSQQCCFVYNDGELCLIVGNIEMEHERILNGMTKENVKNMDRLKFYDDKNVKIIQGYDNVKEYMDGISLRDGKTLCVRDDYIWWGINNEESQYGKILLLNSMHNDVHSMFFDDCGSYIVNARDLDNNNQFIEYIKVKDVHIVHVNTYEMVVDDNYFIEKMKII